MAKLTTPVQKPIQTALDRAGMIPPARSKVRVRGPSLIHPPTVDMAHFKPRGDMVPLPGVVVQVCPASEDMRFKLDPASFAGGEFMAEWHARRAGGATRSKSASPARRPEGKA